jgi:hypothetical protein
MLISLLPRVSVGSWGGGSLSEPESIKNEVVGWSVAIEWLGLFFEFCLGRVEGKRRA